MFYPQSRLLQADLAWGRYPTHKLKLQTSVPASVPPTASNESAYGIQMH